MGLTALVEDFFRGLGMVFAVIVGLVAVTFALAYIGFKGVSVIGVGWFVLALSLAFRCLALPAELIVIGRKARVKRSR